MSTQVDALFYAKVDYKTLQRQSRIIDTKSYVSTLMIKSTFHFTFQIKISHFKPSLMTELTSYVVGSHEVATIRNSN